MSEGQREVVDAQWREVGRRKRLFSLSALNRISTFRVLACVVLGVILVFSGLWFLQTAFNGAFKPYLTALAGFNCLVVAVLLFGDLIRLRD